VEDSRVRTSRKPAKAQASPAQGPDSGESSTASSASCALVRSSSRTCGPSLLAGWTELSPTSTGSGIEWRAASSPLETSAPRTGGSGYSSSLPEWPTPTASEYGSSNNGCPGDGREVYATAGKASLFTEARRDGGTLNPAWVEALMGFPEGWTDGPLDPDTLPLFGSLLGPPR